MHHIGNYVTYATETTIEGISKINTTLAINKEINIQ